jgi:hypothetical protein
LDARVQRATAGPEALDHADIDGPEHAGVHLDPRAWSGRGPRPCGPSARAPCSAPSAAPRTCARSGVRNAAFLSAPAPCTTPARSRALAGVLLDARGRSAINQGPQRRARTRGARRRRPRAHAALLSGKQARAVNKSREGGNPGVSRGGRDRSRPLPPFRGPLPPFG